MSFIPLGSQTDLFQRSLDIYGNSPNFSLASPHLIPSQRVLFWVNAQGMGKVSRLKGQIKHKVVKGQRQTGSREGK